MLPIYASFQFFTVMRVNHLSNRFMSLNRKLLFKKELSVPTFCNIIVYVPFHVKLKPLDVHNYHHCDKLFVELDNLNGEIDDPFRIVQDENNVIIKNCIPAEMCITNLIATITAPIKANLNVHSKFGNISISKFNGEKIVASNESGNITVDGFQGKVIDIKTTQGDINFPGVVQSSLINLQIFEKGSISINKILGEDTTIETKQGNISVNSSYCGKSQFMNEEGDMNLKNIHKHCEVINRKFGAIKITGLDGQLKLTQMAGSADIHLSRVTEDSEINIENGHVLIRLSEECQETTKFNIKSKSLHINENVNVSQFHPNDIDNDSEIEDKKKIVMLNCPNSKVELEAASWFEMNFSKNSSSG